MDLKTINPASLEPPLKPTLICCKGDLGKLENFFTRVNEFGFDTETNVVKTFVERKCRTIQVGNKEEQYVIDLLAFAGSPAALLEQGWKKTPGWASDLVEVLKIGLESDSHLKVGAYLQFDYQVMLWCLGVRPFNFWDCNVIEHIIYAGKVPSYTKDFWGLDDMVARYCRSKIDKSLQKSFDLETELTLDQINYAALDTRVPFPIMRAQKKVVEKYGLQLVAEIENNAIPAFGDMHINGVLLDTGAWMKIVEETTSKHNENVKVLDTYFVPVVGNKNERKPADLNAIEQRWRDERDRELRAEYRKQYQAAAREEKAWFKGLSTFEGEAAINYASEEQLLAALRKMGFGVKKLPDTSDRTLKGLGEPVVQAIRNYRKTEKALSTYGETFLEHINPETGRIHSVIKQNEADTGRTSSTKPNIQNIPRGSAFRKCFIARPGYRMLTVDYSGCELRIIAELSQEKSWIDAFLQGHDLHSVGAELLFGEEWEKAALPDCAYYHKNKQKCKCPGHKALRDKVKAMNFGIAYGMEAGKLADDLGISYQEAELLLKKYKAKFAGVMKFLESAGNFAKMNLYSVTLAGRIRWYKRPDWKSAALTATEKVRQYRGPDAIVTQKDIGRVYYGEYSHIERQGKNSPVQGTNADIAKLAMGCGVGYMWRDLWASFKAELVNFVHDEFVVEVPEEHAEACFKFVGDCMSRAGARLVKLIPMTYEGENALYWTK